MVIVSEAADPPDPGLDAEAQVIALAERMANAVAARLPSGLVLGTDTLVVLDGDILGKPRDDRHAARMVRRLSGREHCVITGLAVLDAESGAHHASSVTSAVPLRQLSPGDIARYVASGEPRDKPGAYAIQGLGGELVAGFEG